MATDYTDFVLVASGESGTIEGLLPLDGSAERFRYKKHIIVNVILPHEAAFINLTGEWKVRIRDSAAREGGSPTGAYIGTILFEQIVKWTAQIIVDQTGSAFWLPVGNGKQQTSICNGEVCAVIDEPSIATDAQWAAYGATGAWRFLDNATVSDSMTPQQKYTAETGFNYYDSSTSFRQFFADWQSAILGYYCDTPEGAILETVYDNWSGGALDSEAHYLYSYVPGQTSIGIAADRMGGLCIAAKATVDNTSGVQFQYRRDDTTDWEDRLFMPDVTAPLLTCADGDEFLLLVTDADKKVLLYNSTDYARSVKLMSKPFENPTLLDGVTLDVTKLQQADICPLPDGGTAILATEKSTSPLKLWLVISRDQSNWTARGLGALPTSSSAKTLGMVHEAVSGGSRLVISNGTDLLRVTGDEGRIFKDLTDGN